MELIHNGRVEEIDPERHATVGDVVAACTERAEGVVVALRLDACEIEEGERAEVARLSTRGPGRLEIVSRARHEIASDGLESAAEYARRIAEAFSKMASLLRDGEIARAQLLCRDCLDAVGVLMEAVRCSSSALGATAAPLEALAPELEHALAAMEPCFAATDWVGLADCVEYEVAAVIARWPERIDAVRGAVEGSA